MPQATAAEIGRPVPAKLEIEVVRKFLKFDSQYAQDQKKIYPHLHKPAPEMGESGTGGVLWVGLNQDPCKAKYLAKCGIVRETEPPPSKKKKKKGEAAPEVLVKKGFDLAAAMSTAPLPYPHWQGELHGPFTRPQTERLQSSMSRSQSVPGTAAASSYVGSRRSSMATSVTRASVAQAVSEEVKRQLEKMSCHEHYLEQAMCLKGDQFAPNCVKPAPTPADLRELMYFGVSADEQGRHSYLHKRHRIMPQERAKEPTTSAAEVGWQAYAGGKCTLGKMPVPFKAPPDTITIS